MSVDTKTCDNPTVYAYVRCHLRTGVGVVVQGRGLFVDTYANDSKNSSLTRDDGSGDVRPRVDTDRERK